MRIVVSSSAIERAVTMLSKVINKKNAWPILSNILCEVKEKNMKLTASDTELTMSTVISLQEVHGEGKFCVPAAKIKDAMSQLSEQPVTIIAAIESDMRLTIQHQTGEVFFPIENADEYPLPAADKYTETLNDIKGEWLRDAIKRTLWATADDGLRPIMSGVYFGLNDGFLDVVASDGHVLVKSKYSVIDKVAMNRIGSFIMPKKVAKILGGIADDNLVNIEWNDSWAHISLWNFDLSFRLIDGKYPNYNSVIPDNQPLIAQVQRSTLINSIRKVLPFTNGSSQMLKLSFEDILLSISGDDFDSFQGATDKLNIEYNGDPIKIGINGPTLLSLLSKLGGMDVTIYMTDPTRPMVIKPNEQPTDCEVLMLTMPMLLDD